jgi:branched-chain amino acid transport system substrate-binding protein
MLTRSCSLFILFFGVFLCLSCGAVRRTGGEGDSLPEKARPQIGRDESRTRTASREKEGLASKESRRLSVGFVLPLTGELASFGQAVLEGSLVAREEFESERGLAIEFEVVDNSEDFATGSIESADIAKRLAGKGVSAVVGPLTTPCVVAAALVLAGDSVLVLSPTSSAYELPDVSFNVFSLGTLCPSLSKKIASFAVAELDIARCAILYPADAYGEFMSRAFIDEIERLGASVTIAVPFATSQTTFEREVRMIALYDPEALFLPARSEDIVQIAPQIPFYGTGDILLLGADGWNYEEVAREGGSYVEGVYFCDSFSAGSPRLLYERFSERYIHTFRKEPTKISAWGYDALTMIVDAWTRAGSARPGPLLAAFVTSGEFSGATGIYRQSGGRLEREGFLFTISGGEIVSLESEIHDPAGRDTTGAQGG